MVEVNFWKILYSCFKANDVRGAELCRKILYSCFKANDIRGAEEARRSLRPFRSVREFSLANCRGREETGLGAVFSIGFGLLLVDH